MRNFTTNTGILIDKATAFARLAWAWWIGEISAFIPQRLRGAGQLIVEVFGESYVYRRQSSDTEISPRDLKPGELVTLRLRPEQVLEYALQLPLSTRSRLREISTNELERRSPIDPAKVLFSHHMRPADKNSRHLNIIMTLVRRDLIDAVALALSHSGLHLHEALVPDSDNRQYHRLKLPQLFERPKSAQKRWAIVLCVATGIVCAGDVYVRAAHQKQVIETLSGRLDQLDQKAAIARDLRTEVQNSLYVADFLAEQKRQPQLGAILAEVTNVLPDGTWVFAFDYDGQKARIEGYSSNPSGLAAAFDATPTFSGASFLSPMTPGPNSNFEHFELSMATTGQGP